MYLLSYWPHANQDNICFGVNGLKSVTDPENNYNIDKENTRVKIVYHFEYIYIVCLDFIHQNVTWADGKLTNNFLL